MAGPPGIEPGTTGLKAPSSSFGPIIWSELKDGFQIWVKANLGKKHGSDVVAYLDKVNPGISSLEDIDAIFAVKGPGWRHKWFAIRSLLKFCQSHGWPSDAIEGLKKVMPRTPQSGVDKRVPKETIIINLLKALTEVPVKYRAFYNVVLDSAIRPMHAIEILSSWQPKKLERVSGEIHKYYADIEREQKHTFIVFLTEQTLQLIHDMAGQTITERGYLNYYQKHKLLRPKHLQKFAYNMMRRHGVDRDVAEFLSGRKPVGVGPRHYAELIGLAEDQYPKYAKYVTELRQKALN